MSAWGAVALALGGEAGNCVATLVVGKWEKAVDFTKLRTELDAGYQAA